MTHTRIRHIPALLAIAATAACTAAPAQPEPPPAVPAELGNDALNDVTIKKCKVGTAAGTSDIWQIQVNVRITNSTATARTYDVAVEATRGDERIATVYAFAENLKPGQKTTAKGMDLLDDQPGRGVKCRLLSATAR